MASSILLSNCSDSLSPFDGIRHVASDGVEFWIGRELMPMLGYPRWADFKVVVERAILSCQNTGNPVGAHFSGLTLKTSERGGRPSEDYKLSRFGAYLTAMNGDPRKPEIAAAQSYFAVKTREAETVQARPLSQLAVLQAAVNQLVEQEDRVNRLEASERQTQQRLITIEAEQDRYQCPSGHMFTVIAYANILKRKISLKESIALGKQAAALCRDRGIAMDSVYDPRFGTVKTYPQDVLAELMGEIA